MRFLGIPRTKPCSRVPNLKSVAQVVLEILTPHGRHDLERPLNKLRSRSFILIPIDFSYTTFYRLSIVTFALGGTV